MRDDSQTSGNTFMTMILLPGKDPRDATNLRWEFRMTLPPRAVSIKHLPEKLDVKRGRLFFRELGSCMNVERPCIVLDCCKVREMDKSTVHLLLCCLEGAIKRNGDVRLAAVSTTAMQSLELGGIARLFRIFDTVDEAVESFQRRVTHSGGHGTRPDGGRRSSANAA
jgi:anti-anti-sigma factor